MTINAIRGMKDLLPQESASWQSVESTLIQAATNTGYQEIRMPILEKTALFKRSIGEVTDIVEKEMYTFEDRNGDSLSLRPEGTASCIRAALEHGLLHNQTQRLWYMGPMFRHERPQKGRYRQFYQFGLEAFGWPGPDIDIEQILLTAQIWEQLGLSHHLSLEINTLGVAEERQQHRAALIAYFEQHASALTEEAQRRLHTNPLRILDSKEAALQPIIENAPKLLDFLSESSLAIFEQVQKSLSAAGVAFTINPRLVRGLDYYTHTVYEWKTTALGAQGTICGGGRFDSLVELLGRKSVPAVGFALGLERLMALVHLAQSPQPKAPHIYLITAGDDACAFAGQQLAHKLRMHLPNLHLVMNCGGGSLKNQFKRANKSGAQYALILGDDELKANQISLKPLRTDAPQTSHSLATLHDYLMTLLQGVN